MRTVVSESNDEEDRMASERDDRHLRIMIENMQREGRSEQQIDRAVREAVLSAPPRGERRF